MQKDTQSNQEFSTIQGMDKNCLKFRSKDGITTYIIRDRNGKMIGMRAVKEPWVNIPVTKCYHDTKTTLVNQDMQEEVENIKVARTQRLTSPFPLPKTHPSQEVKIDTEVKADEKTYSFGMAFPEEWLPGFVLRAMEFKNGGDIKFKVPIPSLNRDVKFGLKFKSKRLELSNNLERTVIGLFTIDFGGKEVKKAANVAAADGSYF
jgi:hypothetical protein